MEKPIEKLEENSNECHTGLALIIKNALQKQDKRKGYR